MSNARLDAIKAQLHTYKQASLQGGELSAYLRGADIDWLVYEVERLRELVDSHRLGFQRRNLELLEQTERLRGLLARLEWAGAYREDSACPVCYSWEPVPGEAGRHESDCWLAAELHR